jgi:hypothetical protein
MQSYFKITHIGGLDTLSEDLALNTIPTCKVIEEYPIGGLGNLKRKPNPICNTHIQGHSKITHVGFRYFKMKILP